ncbi:hypothetical protein LCGC14_0437480 [marine sediment metagenome]|uniref:Uncharacterized protein n=1 Tax=marine sediment metagenome TaxID=412755 RepID=A0A0F9T4Q0_9ZZZZ
MRLWEDQMTRLYESNEYALLSARLTKQELTCIEHCQQHSDCASDCAADGECELQERVADIVTESESEVTNV